MTLFTAAEWATNFGGSRKLHVPKNLAPPETCKTGQKKVLHMKFSHSGKYCHNVLGELKGDPNSIIAVTTTVTPTVSLSDKMLNPPPNPTKELSPVRVSFQRTLPRHIV